MPRPKSTWTSFGQGPPRSQDEVTALIRSTNLRAKAAKKLREADAERWIAEVRARPRP